MIMRAHRLKAGRVPLVGASAVLAAALFLAGCATDSASGPHVAETMRLPPGAAMVSLPAGGPAPISVIERRVGNGVEQTIILESANLQKGENVALVTLVRRPANASRENDGLKTPSIEPNDTQAAIAESVPGVPMTVSPLFLRNAYGPFGYAFGRSGADGCLYAWQRVTEGGGLFAASSTLSIRLRVCRTGASEQQLAGLMTGLTVASMALTGTMQPYQGYPAQGYPAQGSYPVQGQPAYGATPYGAQPYGTPAYGTQPYGLPPYAAPAPMAPPLSTLPSVAAPPEAAPPRRREPAPRRPARDAKGDAPAAPPVPMPR